MPTVCWFLASSRPSSWQTVIAIGTIILLLLWEGEGVLNPPTP